MLSRDLGFIVISAADKQYSEAIKLAKYKKESLKAIAVLSKRKIHWLRYKVLWAMFF